MTELIETGRVVCPPEKQRMIFSRGSQRSPACPWRHALFFRGGHNSLAANGGGLYGVWRSSGFPFQKV